MLAACACECKRDKHTGPVAGRPPCESAESVEIKKAVDEMLLYANTHR